MADVAFIKTFLSSLDARPIKLSGDHVEDPKNFPPRPPYILPRMPKPMSQPPTTTTPGQERSITVHVKSLRSPPLDVKLLSLPCDTTSVLDVKAAVALQTGIPIEKMKMIHNKRPLQDSKVLKELLPAAAAADAAAASSVSVLEFSVMVIGGGGAAAAAPAAPSAGAESVDAAGAATTATTSTSTTEDQILGKDAFWADLTAFLEQQLKSQAKAKELSNLFRSSWQSSKTSS